jgi:hypothetical protein
MPFKYCLPRSSRFHTLSFPLTISVTLYYFTLWRQIERPFGNLFTIHNRPIQFIHLTAEGLEERFHNKNYSESYLLVSLT